MLATVRFRIPDGSEVVLSHGDVIGRLWWADLVLDDGRISEAHALVSLRGRELKLLGLRGRFAVDATLCSELVLRPGLTIELARGLAVEVVSVNLPEEVLALHGPGLATTVLTGVCSLVLDPRPRLAPGHREGGVAQLWQSGEGWRVRVGDAAPRDLGTGDAFTVDARTYRAVAVPLDQAGAERTHAGGVSLPMEMIALYDAFHIRRPGEPPLVLSGIGARILSELASVDGPMGWEALAREIWRDDVDRNTLRRKFDVALSRLRRKLKGERVRTDLVRADGTGSFELLRYPGDVVEDRT
ncbi:MAG: hypothetical protein ACI8PZ_004351 [Myxococcota bacterium]|jgi:hypothetical protein